MKKYSRCILILADGARPDVFEELLEKGELPHCKKLFKQQGRFAPATGVFPSTTGPAYLPYLTGCYPGTCNMPGIRWFDKKKYGEKKPRHQRYRSYVGFESFFMNHDIRLSTPTLFQFFKKPVNIFSAINRGTTFKANKSKHSRIWYWYYAHLTDRWNVVDEAATRKLLQVVEEDFDFAFVVYPGIDEFSHLSHPRSPNTLTAYRYLDKALGEVSDALQKKGILDETLIVVVSDHGLSQTHKHFGLASFLEERGIKTFYYPKIFKWNFDAASMVSGNGMLHLYFRNPQHTNGSDGWLGRTSFEELEKQRGELLQELLAEEAVDILLGQNRDGSVIAVSKRGKALIRLQEEKIHYQVLTQDPFGYPNLPTLMSSQESLELTAKTVYPDALMQALQIFRSERTGDWVISAAKGWDLRKRFEHPEHKSSHGGLLNEQILVPFYANAPISNKTVRSVDVFPTILQLLGKPIPKGIDGSVIPLQNQVLTPSVEVANSATES